jgi:hypothetical protein
MLDSYTPETDGSEGLSLLFSTKAIWPASLIWEIGGDRGGQHTYPQKLAQ